MHQLLRKQIETHFGNALPSALAESAHWQSFLVDVENVYEQAQAEKDAQQQLISRLEQAHNQLLQSEKMAAIGSLAAGVAHEINNPIGFVGSNLNSLHTYVEDLLSVIEVYAQAAENPALLESARHKAKEVDLGYLKKDVLILIDECRDGIGRVRRIVQDLKDFSHVDQAEWVMADLHKGLDSTLNIVNNEIKYKATVERHYGPIPAVHCIGSQLNQVFMNLLVNAAHAIEKQGVITVTTQSDDQWVKITVADTGSGIPQENLKRIFDPFFTTKPVGKGTGLGLSLSYGIVKRHGGKITVESEVGKGTAFTVWIPIQSQGEDSPKHVPSPSTSTA